MSEGVEKPRYIAAELWADWGILDMRNEKREPLANHLTRGEAQIMVFALNAIADGDMLAKDWGEADVFDPTKMEYYQGPTEGVKLGD